ncbi:MAG: thiol reductant ABC exporter subunit CydC [Desulfonatronovibrionaceae bacterium]
MKVLLRLLKLMLPQWKWLLAGLACSVLTLGANAGLLALAAWFLACMAAAGLSGQPFNYHFPAGGIRTLALVRTLARYGERLLSHEATFRLLTHLRVWFFAGLEPLAPVGVQDIHSGDAFSRIKADIDKLDEFYLRCVLPVAAALVVLSAVFLFIGFFSRQMALALGGLWLITGVFLPWLCMYLGRDKGKTELQTFASMRILTVDLLKGLEELSVLGRVNSLIREISTKNRSLARAQAGLARIEALSDSGMVLGSGLGLWAVLMLGIPLVKKDLLTGANLPMLAVLGIMSFEALQQLPSAFKSWGGIKTAAERLLAVTEAEPVIEDPLQEAPPPEDWSIRLENITFRYWDRQENVFENFSLSIAAGEKILLTGPSGRGKSSVLHMLTRLYPVQEGRILIGGRDITLYRAETVRSWMGVVLQNPHIFNAGIRENLKLARPEASDENLVQALARVRLDDFVLSLPQGLDTQLGQAGMKLSGGQARRLAIARVMLRDAPVLILDEPAEGLDEETWADIQEVLIPFIMDKTLILISHKTAGLRWVDRAVRI